MESFAITGQERSERGPEKITALRFFESLALVTTHQYRWQGTEGPREWSSAVTRPSSTLQNLGKCLAVPGDAYWRNGQVNTWETNIVGHAPRFSWEQDGHGSPLCRCCGSAVRDITLAKIAEIFGESEESLKCGTLLEPWILEEAVLPDALPGGKVREDILCRPKMGHGFVGGPGVVTQALSVDKNRRSGHCGLPLLPGLCQDLARGIDTPPVAMFGELSDEN